MNTTTHNPTIDGITIPRRRAKTPWFCVERGLSRSPRISGALIHFIEPVEDKSVLERHAPVSSSVEIAKYFP